jgi:cyclohexanecarboxyl-CoA dehydrogenase
VPLSAKLPSQGNGSLFFDDVRVPACYRLGDENRGSPRSWKASTAAARWILCRAVARKSLDQAWHYTRTRFTFGKALSEYQGVTVSARRGRNPHHGRAPPVPPDTLAQRPGDFPHTAEAAMCKWGGPKLAYDIVNTCLLRMDTAGIRGEMPFEQRRATCSGCR